MSSRSDGPPVRRWAPVTPCHLSDQQVRPHKAAVRAIRRRMWARRQIKVRLLLLEHEIPARTSLSRMLEVAPQASSYFFVSTDLRSLNWGRFPSAEVKTIRSYSRISGPRTKSYGTDSNETSTPTPQSSSRRLYYGETGYGIKVRSRPSASFHISDSIGLFGG